MKHRYAGLIFAILGATLFSFKPVLVKLVYQYDVDSLTILLWRMIFALPLYLLIGAVAFYRSNSSAWRYRDLLQAAAIGVVGYYIAALCDLIGLQYVSAQLERIVLFTYPTMVTLLGWWFFGHAIRRFTVPALLVTYTGIALIFLHDLENYGSNVILGSGWVLLASLCCAVYVLFSKAVITRLGSVLFTCVAMSAASVVILIHHIIENGLTVTLPQHQALYLISIIAIPATVAPSFLLSAAIQLVGPMHTSIIGTIGPVMTSLFAVWLLAEPFTIYHLLGMALVLGAILVLHRQRTKDEVIV